jgi:hypothetical protein
MQKRILLGLLVAGSLIGFIPVGDSETISLSEPPFDGTLSGYVNDTSMNPIEGALVRVHFHGTYEENYTDETGYYHVTNIPICYCLKNCTASKEGYYPDWVLMGIVEDRWYDFVLTSIPSPDLDCEGELKWENVEPGATLTDSFEISNTGEPESLLAWKIVEYPEWGEWSFSLEAGGNLTTELSPITIDVEVIAPDEQNREYEGEIRIENWDDSEDYCLIPVRCTTDLTHSSVEYFGENPIFFSPVFGFYPEVFVQNITYWMGKWWTITEQRFQGFIGENIILGFYLIGGPW